MLLPETLESDQGLEQAVALLCAIVPEVIADVSVLFRTLKGLLLQLSELCHFERLSDFLLLFLLNVIIIFFILNIHVFLSDQMLVILVHEADVCTLCWKRYRNTEW